MELLISKMVGISGIETDYPFEMANKGIALNLENIIGEKILGLPKPNSSEENQVEFLSQFEKIYKSRISHDI